MGYQDKFQGATRSSAHRQHSRQNYMDYGRTFCRLAKLLAKPSPVME